MATIDARREIETENQVRARDMVSFLLRDWDFMGWSNLLAQDVVLSLKLGAIGLNEIAGFEIVLGELQVIGAANAMRVLDSFYDEMRRNLTFTAKLISGYDVVMAGNLVIRSTKQNGTDRSYPISIYMRFNSEGRIENMTIAQVDLHPMAGAIWSAAQGDTVLSGKDTN